MCPIAPVTSTPACVNQGHPLNVSPVDRVFYTGKLNFDKVLNHLKRQFPLIETVWLMGISAGGGGANLHHHAVRQAFDRATVHLIEDSSPGFGSDGVVKTPWGSSYPPACIQADGITPCASVQDLREWNRRSDPNFRYAFLSFQNDPVTRPPNMTKATFRKSLKSLIAGVKAQTDFPALSNALYIDNVTNAPNDACLSHVVSKINVPARLASPQRQFISDMVQAPADWTENVVVQTLSNECPGVK